MIRAPFTNYHYQDDFSPLALLSKNLETSETTKVQ